MAINFENERIVAAISGLIGRDRTSVSLDKTIKKITQNPYNVPVKKVSSLLKELDSQGVICVDIVKRTVSLGETKKAPLVQKLPDLKQFADILFKKMGKMYIVNGQRGILEQFLRTVKVHTNLNIIEITEPNPFDAIETIVEECLDKEADGVIIHWGHNLDFYEASALHVISRMFGFLIVVGVPSERSIFVDTNILEAQYTYANPHPVSDGVVDIGENNIRWTEGWERLAKPSPTTKGYKINGGNTGLRSMSPVFVDHINNNNTTT